MDMLIYRLSQLIKGLRAIKEEMEENGYVEFRGISIDGLIKKAIIARNNARDLRRFIPEDFLTGEDVEGEAE
ncbi:hypothetical protein KJ975_05265 [Myxococcota bacterium]|nr:hypothetical protein [Myxococcota bacterium]